MLRIDPAASVPPFAQLREQVTAQIRGGELRPGERLPTVRRLAGDLGIAPNTVARAYRELEADGLVVGRGRAGTVVTGPSASPRSSQAEGAAAEQAAADYVRAARALGLPPSDALLLVRRALGI